MAVDPSKVVLYTQGTFSIPDPDPQQVEAMLRAAKDISGSGFGTVILGQWHVHPDGGIYYNDSPLETVAQTLKVIPTALKEGGAVKKVLITFGPFAADFTGIKNNLAQFKRTVAGLQAETDIDGLDFDLEQEYDPFGDLLVDLTQWANGLEMMVTAAPYVDIPFWVDVLKRTNGGTSPGFSWWNLQLYGGAAYPEWVGALDGLVPDAQAFLVPGFNVEQGSSPDGVRMGIGDLITSFPSLEGGFIWQYENIEKCNYRASQYAEAIVSGLGGSRRTATPLHASA